MEDILIYWSIIRKRLWLILILVASTMGTTLIISYMQRPVYQASVKFRVTAPPPADVSLFSGRYNPVEDLVSTRNSFIDVLTDRAVARQVIETLQLSMDPEELQASTTVEKVELQVQSSSKESQSDSGLMKVNVRNSDPDLAATLVNTLIETALQRYGEIRARPKTMSREFISLQLKDTRQELNQAQEALIVFQVENKIGALPQAIASQQALIYDLRKQRDQAYAQGHLQEVAGYDQLILERQVELQDLVRLGSEYARLEAAVEQGKSTYGFLLEKETEAKLKENETLTLGFMEVSGPAKSPSRPLPRVKMSFLALGGVLSLIVGVMVAFIWNYLELRSPRPAESVERDILPSML